MKLGIIGLGNMGKALANAWSKIHDVEVFAYTPNPKPLHGIVLVQNLKELLECAEYIVLAVKPHMIEQILSEINSYLRPNHCLISIAAGIQLEQLQLYADNCAPVVRLMPTTTVLVNAGIFAVCFEDENLQLKQRDDILSLLNQTGLTYEFPEKLFDGFTGLIGSGPAYICYLMEGFIDAGVDFGFTREVATQMTYALFEGSAKLAIESKQHITSLKEMVISPGGTTSAALLKLEEKSVKYSIFEALRAAVVRSSELKQNK